MKIKLDKTLENIINQYERYKKERIDKALKKRDEKNTRNSNSNE